MSNVFKGTVAALALLAAAPAAFATDKVTMQIDGAAVPVYAPPRSAARTICNCRSA